MAKTGFDIIIRGGMVFDGSGSDPFAADVGITGDRFSFIGRAGGAEAAMFIDAQGLAVAPGFIDTHSHSDFTILADPRAEGKISQGITTEIIGNCGMSAAPLFDKACERREEDLKELGISERWHTLEEYFRLVVKRGIAVNMAVLAGHGNIRGSVVGYDDREPEAREFSEMKRLLNETLDQGAIGLSTGLIYPPGLFADTDELVGLSRPLAERNLIYTSHMRSEGDELLEAAREVVRIGRESGARVHISHIKTAGQKNWHKADDLISLLLETRLSGILITCDRYPYTASSTDLDALLPAWTYDGGNDAELKRLQDPVQRKRIAREMLDQASGSDYWKRVTVASVASEKNRWMEGKSIEDISEKLGLSPIEAVFQVLMEERLRVGAIFASMNEENLRKFLSLPFCMVGTDSSARSFDGPTRTGKPHPRGFGAFPRLIGGFVREEGLFSLQEAVRRATSLAAETFGLRGRGSIREGMFADLVIFDPGRVRDRSTFDDPFQGPEGVHYVLVNGVPVVWEGEANGRLQGRILGVS
ncbi:MAG: D-aminoacylase [Nitrospiraceae bacterium]|nr:D-aminoacylase [Nitrospiraceae bacterium]